MDEKMRSEIGKERDNVKRLQDKVRAMLGNGERGLTWEGVCERVGRQYLEESYGSNTGPEETIGPVIEEDDCRVVGTHDGEGSGGAGSGASAVGERFGAVRDIERLQY
ncbi:unnamed protein product [Sphagnum balticum]